MNQLHRQRQADSKINNTHKYTCSRVQLVTKEALPLWIEASHYIQKQDKKKAETTLYVYLTA